MITIEDNGPGLTPAQIKNLNHPLQTSSPDGLGLGLSIIRSVAERHRGSLQLFPIEPHGLKANLKIGKKPSSRT